MAAIVRLGLVRLVDAAVVMHQLVQAVLRDHTPVAEQDVLRVAAAQILIGAAPQTADDPREWPRWAALYPHTLPTRIVDLDRDECRDFYLRMCDYLRSAGNYPAARALAQAVVDQWRRTLGEDHPHTITAVANLASAVSAKPTRSRPTPDELRIIGTAISRELRAQDLLPLPTVAEIILRVVPRIGPHNNWAGTGKLTSFLATYLPEFVVEDRELGRVVRSDRGFSRRLLGR